jgi:methylation protein EvaC
MLSCRICATPLSPFISFGKQPLGNGFLSKENFLKEYFFDLEVCFCPTCTMVQLAQQPEPEKMFNESYAFFSGTSQHMARHFERFASDVQKRYLTAPNPFVVEIGSNDGILLKNFAKSQVRHLGIEPSGNVAEAGRKNGVETWCTFFSQSTARDILKKFGQADAILSANVLCHIPDQNEVLRAIDLLLSPKGVVIFEDPYLGDIIEKTSYDQIYDEHVYLFSLGSVQNLYNRYGFELVDVEPQSTHGGSMRYHLARRGSREVSARVETFLLREREAGLSSSSTYEKFRRNCEKSKEDLLSLLKTLKNQGKRVVGYAATSKSTTVINYCGLTPDLVEFISDTTPIKQGKFSPGGHIPVVSPEAFKKNYPDYALLFGWNHKNEILAKEEDFTRSGGKWIVYVPKIEVL